MNALIEKLPDYTTLKKLAAALWRQGSAFHGAAIMIGAGFSRSGASTSDLNKKLPLWGDLSRVLAKELGASESGDPLRLAEEYAAFFGSQALHDLVKSEVNDAAWIPGEIHKSLLELPWSEVLTTNWDTLLERASADVHQPIYNTVVRQEDLSNARSPRIVKLHGTVNLTDNLIFTQEDYRKYPQRHAAFVNFARQIFIENELCLLGFSGDDPNFLQWAGWVRDHLATHARRIYLVGALNLTSSKRKYLESINVAPIDLHELVADYDDQDAKHSAATRIFLETLQRLKPSPPWEWSPTLLQRPIQSTEEIEKSLRDPNYAAKLLEQQVSILEADRNSYPNWLVCPTKQRWELRNQINSPYPSPNNLSAMDVRARTKLLYEISWRHSITNDPVTPWLVQELLSICDPSKPCALSKKQQLEVALLLLKNTRWVDDPNSKQIEAEALRILTAEARYWPESSNEVLFHKSILARDGFDYIELEGCVEKIDVKDCVWKLRKSSLLAELGRFEEGEALLADAYRELLDQHHKDRDSIYVFSRLAWAHWQLRGAEAWNPKKEFKAFPASYQESKCAPWDHIEEIQNKIAKALEKQEEMQAIEPSFEPGRYKDKSNTISFSGELHPLILLDGVSNSAGMPLRWEGVGFLVEQARRLLEIDEITHEHRFSIAIRTSNSDTSSSLKRVFSRLQVADAPEAVVSKLLDRCLVAIKYWAAKRLSGEGKQRNHALDRLRVFIEVAARLCVRATPEQAKQVLHLAFSLGKKEELRHLWLLDPLKHLIDYSLESTPKTMHHELLLDALSFPLKSEVGDSDRDKWPNPIISHPGKREANLSLDRRIDELIEKISTSSSRNSSILLRILPLYKKGFLNNHESQKIAEKIWGKDPDYQSIPETGLLKHVLLILPAMDDVKVKDLYKRSLLKSQAEGLFDLEFLMDATSAAQTFGPENIISEKWAIESFDSLMKWQPKDDGGDPFGFFRSEQERVRRYIGKFVARAIAPVIPREHLSQNRFDALIKFFSEGDVPECIGALPYFAEANSDFRGLTEKIIRKGLRSRDSNQAGNSAHALLTWRGLSDSVEVIQMTSILVSLVGLNRASGLASQLWTITKLFEMNCLQVADIDYLIEMLPIVFDDLAYGNISAHSKESVSASLARAECVRLASAFLKKDQNHDLLEILRRAKIDSLPEVRFADENF
ncbi:hypothetical protein GmRootV118_28640 [Variovorax sp. V118]|uniref:SIR2 family protein n=1 Tax=Variovorax sp. V118 TaxID=3065954 RepID=UPI0034E8E899